jgi:predicted amidohydrolase
MEPIMKNIYIATAQFQPKRGDKDYNLSVIRKLAEMAVDGGAKVVSFHELCLTSYTFLRNLPKHELMELAEEVPAGKGVQTLIKIAAELNIAILAGLLEREEDQLYNTYVCVTGEGLVARYRKIHPFISKYLSAGNEYVVFDLYGWRCGILICYDNNIIENVRATALLGAEIIFMPHVTCCTPSSMPGRGWVNPQLWHNRQNDPVSLRLEFDGPKGKRWLMRWLPARAYDNGIYVVFSNPIGMEDDQLKNGNSMILDPYGEILAECRSFDDEVVVGYCTADKLKLCGGYRYRNARKPELYGDIIKMSNRSVTRVPWLNG